MDLCVPGTALPTKAVHVESWSLVLCLMQMASSRLVVPALTAYEDLLGLLSNSDALALSQTS